MIAVIVLMVPLTIPKVFGIHIYGVMSGSMTPLYAIGGVVYVKPCGVNEVEVGDVISYTNGTDTEFVTTHRVVAIQEDSFITKGDANNANDAEPVRFSRLVGKVIFYLPKMANLANYLGTFAGGCVFIGLFAISFFLFVFAEILKQKNAGVEEKKNAKEKRSTKRKVNLPLILGGMILVGALLYLGHGIFTYVRSDKLYADLAKEVFDLDAIENKEALAGNEEAASKDLSEKDKAILKRLNVWHEKYPDLIGWIQIPDTKINYPIMQGDDDLYYLSHAYTGESNNAGSIFLTTFNNPGFSHIYSILYGHNMRNGSMFGGLHKYEQEEDYLKKHPSVYVYSLTDVYVYDIFSFYNVDATDAVYSVFYSSVEEFEPVLKTMIERNEAPVPANFMPNPGQGILSLSTCNGASGRRFVVHAARR